MLFDMGLRLSLVLRERHKLMFCENRMLRKVFGPKKNAEERGGENGIAPTARQPIEMGRECSTCAEKSSAEKRFERLDFLNT